MGRLRQTITRARNLPLAFWVMFVDTFTMAVGFYMLIPLFAYHLLENVGLTATVVGVVAAVRSFSQQGVMAWSGAMADRIGYRNAICAGVLIRAVGFAMFGVFESVPGLLLGSVLAGFGGSLFHPASYATYGVLTDHGNRVTIYSIRELLSNVGFVIGPVIGGFLAVLDFRWVCFLSAGLFASTAALSWFGLPALRPYARAADAPTFRQTLRTVGRDPTFVRFVSVIALAWALVAQLYLAVPVIAQDVLGRASSLGTVYSVGAVFMVLTMVPLSRWSERRLLGTPALALGTALLVAGLLTMGLIPVVAALYGGVVLFTLGQVLLHPMMNSVVSRLAPESGMASYFGVNGFGLAVGGFIGNTGGGLLYDLADRPGLGWVPWAVFAAWGLVAIVALLRARGPIARGVAARTSPQGGPSR